MANTVCHPLLAKRRAAEKAALKSKAAEAAAAALAVPNKISRSQRPTTAQGRSNGPGAAHTARPASAMARMNQSHGSHLSESLRRTFAEHDSRMSAMPRAAFPPSPKVDLRDANFVQMMPSETPSKVRRASAGPNRILSGFLDASKGATVLSTDFEGGRAGVVKMGEQVLPRSTACTNMPPKVRAATSAELSRTMDARLETMIGWAERATDSSVADSRLSDWFGKWLTSYEQEQNAFRSAQVYGDIKMSEAVNSSSLQRLETPNRFRTAVVCDMFQRIMPIFGRYEGLMKQVRHEMMMSIYPDLCDSDQNVFDKVPFFARNAALVQEVSDLKKERGRLMQELSDEEESLIDLQRKVREYREEIQSVKLEAAWSRAKQNQEDLFLLSQKNGGDERQELMGQNKKLKSDMQTETLLRQAAQDRAREMQNDMDMLKIRVQTAEQEWKDSCRTVDSLRKELSIAQARNSADGGSSRMDLGSTSNLSILDWVNKVLGAPADKPLIKDVATDLRDCRIYFELLSVISGESEKLQRDVQMAKMRQTPSDLSAATADIFSEQLACTLFDGEQLLATQPFVHRTVLLELLCSYNDVQAAKDLPEGKLGAESQERASVRRSTIASILRDTYELAVKCQEQTSMLEEIVGEQVEDAELESHAASKLTWPDVEVIIAKAEPDCDETERIEMAHKCMQLLQHKNHALHGVFHYYCKMAERAVDAEKIEGNKQTLLSGMETMDEDELEALLTASKLQLPSFKQARMKAFADTIEKLKASCVQDVNLGMGFAHFEECLVRLSVELAPQWAKGESAVVFVSEALETLLTHIDLNCERLQHVEFGTAVRAEGMKDLWERYEPELRQGFKRYCSQANQCAMTLHDFIRYLKDMKVPSSRLSVPSMVDIFSCVQEEASEDNSADTMDFQEFMEALAAW